MEPEQPILNIVGDKVALGPIRRDLLPTYQRWINDFAITRSLLLPMGPTTAEAETAWYDRVAGEGGGRDVVFTAYDRATLTPIGTTGLHQIDHLHGTCEFGILIGEKAYWGRGYGTEMTRLMLDYAFTALSMTNVMLRVYAYNHRAIRAYEKAGFKEFGRRRQARRFGDASYDVVYMDCLAAEFQSLVLRQYLPTSDAG